MSKSNSRKKLSSKLKNDPVKTPISLKPPESYDKMCASWRFSLADTNSRWSISENDWKVWHDHILPKLINFEGMTWAEIKAIPKGVGAGSKHHNIEVSRLSKDAQNEILERKLFYDNFFSLRLTAKSRLFGVLEQGALYLLWYDHSHEICPVADK